MKVVSFDASAYVGKTVRIQVYDKADKHWGHVNADDFRAADKPVGTKAAGIPKPGVMDAAHRTFPSYLDVGYDQPRRPQFHFTSRKNWLNDPNGMVHYDGEYHLYFQHHALGLGPGKKSWGHAVSKDMVHWEQLPHAILPYSGGAIWSGTAVVDHNNSLGKQVGDTKTIVAFFTLATRPKFFQAAAYSTDRGRTFTLVKKGEAVVPNQMSVGERDPKVFWHAAGKKWVMVLWVGGGRPSTIRFFTSDNMVDWTVAGDIKRAWAAECMDFVELPVDGDAKNKKWVLYDASFDYEVGTYDGNVFRLEGETHKGDLGSCFYAAQTFNNSPDARTVMIGWMREKKDSPFIKAGMPFNQAMSFPTTMELRTTPDGIRLYRWPVKEIDTLVVKSHTFENLTVASAAAALAGVKAELVDLSIAFEPAGVETMNLTIRGLTVTYDKAAATFTHNKRALPAPTVDGLVKLRVLVDRASIELFANEGAAVATHYAEPAAKDRSISIAAKGALKIKSLVVNELKSAW
ncbi:glycoside hydrolase family 32 protein, partial [bacterium]|nr:glycoside hydrolase family 32 protein [bacterium]